MSQEDNNTKYVFYCTNRDSGVIIDYIGWRKGTLARHDVLDAENDLSEDMQGMEENKKS